MTLNAAEEESIEAIKKWWDENGKQLIAAVIVVFGGYGGCSLWQNSELVASNQLLFIGVIPSFLTKNLP